LSWEECHGYQIASPERGAPRTYNRRERNPANPAMSSLHCLSCERENPHDANFCQACGSTLNLKLCKQCEAINAIRAQACYQCGTRFALPQGVAVKQSSVPWRRPARTAAIAAGVITVLATSGFAYRSVYRQPVAAASNVASQPALMPTPQPVAAPVEHEAAPAPAPAPARAKAPRTAVTHTRPASAPPPAPTPVTPREVDRPQDYRRPF
jgi:ribosomal protein L40E